MLAYKKTRSISEGNFHSCYAFNKAEKFKFRRLTLGLESCAQAQSQLLKKEEKQLVKQLQELQGESQRNGNRCLSIDGRWSLDRNLFEDDHHGGLKFRKKRKPNRIDSLSVRRGSLGSTIEKRETVEEVVPFYMQHGYVHYHNDPHYDNVIKRKQKMSGESLQQLSDQPSWYHQDKLSRLKERRNAVLPVDEKELKFLTDLAACKLNENETNVNEVVPSEKSSIVLPNIQPDKNSINQLTSDSLNRYQKHGYETAKTKRRHTLHPVEKSIALQNLLLEKLEEGTLSDKGFDELLNTCDESHVFPAYNADQTITFADFRCLRKCKYLRLSKLNWESLKQATKDLMLKEI